MSQQPEPDRIFYDGSCGVCHRGVRFILRRDRGPDFFHFAPIGGETWQRLIPESCRNQLPDSIIVRCADGSLLMRFRALRYVAKRLGTGWRCWAMCAMLIPPPVGDWCYDRFASIRHRLASHPKTACPLVSEEQRQRFEA